MNDGGLRARLRPGRPATLILGAGVSYARGVPLWPELLRQTWIAVFGRDPHSSDNALLVQARLAARDAGLPADFIERLDTKRHPLEAQFAFEHIFDELRWEDDKAQLRRKLKLRQRPRRTVDAIVSNEQLTSELFADLLRKILYRGQPRNAARHTRELDTMSLIARAVIRSAQTVEHRRLISQVITFNVDDLLEREVNARCSRRVPYAVPIARASADRPAPGRHCIPVYHLHGFVPKRALDYPHRMEDSWIEATQPPTDALVFTDEQYWRVAGNPTGFASRVFRGALRGHCIFIGLSMTDINIIRWLAQDAIERSDDFRRMVADWTDSTEVESSVLDELQRHYWITDGPELEFQKEPMATQVLQTTLSLRGVARIRVSSWESKEFHDWWNKTFLP